MDEPTIQWLFNAVFTLSVFMGGWILNTLTRSIRTLDDDVRDMPEKYVLKSDYVDAQHRIEQALTRIEAKLDGKVDKP